ncbi:TPA: tandem-95 repeat protein, partial [Candidatus Poribacteria bacterium]|nr:tandem-95 repeat protein [Candidatus Poribacteria bacterium]
IEAVNDIPTANAQSVEILEDTVASIKLAASDVEGDDLIYVIVDAPRQGSLAGDVPDLSYTPDADFNGTDSFSFIAKDQDQTSGFAVVDVRINEVNDAPVANDQLVMLLENTEMSITLAATDAENDPLTYTLVSVPQDGTVSNVDLPRLTYHPNENFNGTDHLTYIASDGELVSETATVDITVVAVNVPPVAIEQGITTSEDTRVAIILKAMDIKDETLTYTITSNPSHGVLSGTTPNLIYLPNLNYHGDDVFAFTASDGTDVSQPADINIKVASVNDPPKADPKSITLAEDAQIPIVLSGTDVENQKLTYEVVSVPSHGTLSGRQPNLVYTPQPNFNGRDQLSYGSSDGFLSSDPAVISITVTPTNDPPISMDVTKALAQKSQGNQIQLTADDVDGDPLTYQILSAP